MARIVVFFDVRYIGHEKQKNLEDQNQRLLVIQIIRLYNYFLTLHINKRTFNFWNFSYASLHCQALYTNNKSKFKTNVYYGLPATSFTLKGFLCISLVEYFRSTHPEVFCKKGVLRNFLNSQGNTCARVSFLIKLLKKRLWQRCFPANFVKFLRTPFFSEHFLWLLLVFAARKIDTKEIISAFISFTFFSLKKMWTGF